MIEEKKVKKFVIEEASISDMAAAMSEGTITSRELVLMYMKRIAEIDKRGPSINSVLELNPDAIHIAEALDEERKHNGARGILHGIPILIKDNINTFDKMHTSAGALALSDNYGAYDAFIVTKLRNAGAVILGKTNLTELANFMTEGMPNGFSSRGGQVKNPYGEFDVSGSSSGSAAAVTANLCAAAIGTETSGSILSPACQNSIVGIKPTIGLVSRSGIIPIAHSQDTAGPMARTVEDAAILLTAIAGPDENDAATSLIKMKPSIDYTSCLNPNGLKDSRIGIPKDYYHDELNDEMKEIMKQVADKLGELGAVVIEDDNIDTARDFSSWNVLVYEFKSDLNAYLASQGQNAPVKSLREIIEYNMKHPKETLKFGQKILLDSEKTSGTLTESEYINEKLRDLELSQVKGIDAYMERNKLDAMLFPTSWGCDISARAGYPSIAVPAGYLSTGEPFGITFAARAFQEDILIKLAYSFEQATKLRKPPNLK
ncbi:MAG: amidase family protein [Bacillota bacterium]